MKAILKLTILTVLITTLSCAGPPKRKLDRLYHELQEVLPRLDPSILDDRIIVLDPGHGGFFRGTMGPDGLDEASVNLGVALYLGGLLMEAGAEVHFTRSADRDFLLPADSSLAGDLKRRIALMDSIRPDIFISIHHNAQSDRKLGINAVETYYRFGDPASRDLAFAVHRHLMRNLGIKTGEVKQGNYYVLRSVEIPAILGEASYLTNPSVEDKLRLSDKQRLEAEAYFLGILDYFHRGTPRITSVSPEESTLSYVPNLVFKAEDVGGLGIDAEAIFMRINGRSVRPFFNRKTGSIIYPLPWNAPNGLHNVSLYLRNLMGNASCMVDNSFFIDLPPERAVFHMYPENPRQGWGIVRVKVLLLDERGLKIADGSGVNIKSTTCGINGKTYVDDGFVEFLCRPPSGADSLGVSVICKGRSFSHTFKRASGKTESPGAMFIKKIMVDGRDNSPISGAFAQIGDSLYVKSSREGICLIPSNSDSGIVTFSAMGYRPRVMRSAARDTIHMYPWFNGVLLGKRFILDPRAGSSSECDAGELGLTASYVNLEVAQYLSSFLRLAGAQVILTRENEESRTPQDVVALTNKFNADRYIEIRHDCMQNAPNESKLSHVKTFFFPGSSRGKAMAEAVGDAFSRICEVPADSAGEMVTYPLQQTACPAIVVDAPSIKLVPEEIKLGEPWYLRLQAYAIFIGLLNTFHTEDKGELSVRIEVGGDESGWLVTLDHTWNMLTSPEGLVRFYALGDGAHIVTIRKHGTFQEKAFTLSPEKNRKEIIFRPTSQGHPSIPSSRSLD